MEPLLTGAISIFFLLLLFVHFRKPNPEKTTLKCYPIVGHVPSVFKNRHRLLDWQTDVLSSVPSNTIFLSLIGDKRGVATANPANVEYFLKTSFDSFPKGQRNISLLEDFLGQGIFNSDGYCWKAQRKTASFEFNTKSLRSFFLEKVNQEITSCLSPLLKKAASDGDILDLQDVLERLAFDNVCQIAFNANPACLTKDFNADDRFFSAFRDAATITGERFRYTIPSMWKLKKRLNLGSERRLKEAIAIVNDFAYGVIGSRKEEMKRGDISREDILSRFMSSNSDNSDTYLRDAVVSFILAGKDTTSAALSWLFWILSNRPDVEERILNEIRSVRGRNSKEDTGLLGFAELKEMNYLHAALSEAMRLYPPVPFNITTCALDTILPDGTAIRAGDTMSYNTYAMGRMREIWGEDCYEFKPERWLGPEGEFRPESPFKYPIFHGGPRSCLGKEMAYLQMKSVAATMIENFVVEVVGDGRRPDILLSLTLKMRGGLPVIIKERSR